MLTRVPIPSPNYSSRGGAGVRLVVVHTAEGALTYQSLGSFFQNPASGVSSHVGIDDTPGTVGWYVRDEHKAWTQANANPYAVAAELCAFAAWSHAEWNRHPGMLNNCAQWIAESCVTFGIPNRKLSPGEAQGGAAGVCAHSDLGAWGGNHSDPGPAFPWDRVIGGGVVEVPTPAKRRGRNMIASTATGNGYWTVTSDGAVYAFGDARYAGNAFSPDIVSGEIIGIAGKGNDGYWLYASDGGVFTFGSALFYGRPDRA